VTVALHALSRSIETTHPVEEARRHGFELEIVQR
jgi:hypothetical protein